MLRSLENQKSRTQEITEMKTTKIIIAFIAASIATAASFAAVDSNRIVKKGPQPQDFAILMFADSDANNDGALDSVELAKSIENLYAWRNEAISNRREMLVAKGLILEEASANGFITMNLLPEDAAAILMKDGDANQDLLLEADELVATVGSLRKLNLSARAPAIRQS
jgi:hypothetical protein